MNSSRDVNVQQTLVLCMRYKIRKYCGATSWVQPGKYCQQMKRDENKCTYEAWMQRSRSKMEKGNSSMPSTRKNADWYMNSFTTKDRIEKSKWKMNLSSIISREISKGESSDISQIWIFCTSRKMLMVFANFYMKFLQIFSNME